MVLLFSTVYCSAGNEGNATCVPCKADFFKSVSGREPCEQCTGNFTSDGNTRISCNVCKYNYDADQLLYVCVLAN